MRLMLIALASLFVLAACGPSSPPASSANGAPASTSTGCSCHAQTPAPETK